MSMQVEDARVICPCMMAPSIEREPARTRPEHERSAGLLVVALILATATLGFSVVSPTETLMVSNNRGEASLVTVQLDPAQLPALSTGLRSEFSLAMSEDQLELARQTYFETKIPYGALIYREANRNGLEPELVAAVVRVESGFYPDRVSIKNAIGLMQVIPSTGELMGVSDLTDPVENVRAGTKYLKYLSAEFEGDQILALAAYNAGEGTVRRYDGVPPYRETRAYVRKVSAHRHAYSRTVERLASSLVDEIVMD